MDGLTLWRLPIDLYTHPEPRNPLCCCCTTNAGECIQSNNGNDTHTEELRFAYDFSLPIGTPVLAAADGEVAAAVGSFHGGGRGTKENRARANYVAVRHANGLYSRYYHLQHGGVAVSVGQRVVAGQVIGYSGNTGFSGAPHLHFDVVDALPLETATLTLVAPPAAGAAAEERRVQELACVAACFSGALPSHGARPIQGAAVWAEPPTACDPTLSNAGLASGGIVLIDRCKDVDFLDKCLRAEAAGALGVVVVNYSERLECEMLTMGLPAAVRGQGRTIGIPALFVSAEAGAAVKAAIADASDGGAPTPTLRIGRSAHFVARRTEDAPDAAKHHTAELLKVTSDFVALTIPARFEWPGHPEGYLPIVGKRPPEAVQTVRASGGGGVVTLRVAPEM